MSSASVARASPTLVQVGIGGERHVVHALWLRDACSCPECRQPNTNERLLDSATIDPSITIVDVADGDPVEFTMSDRHIVQLDRDWLVAHLRAVDQRDSPAAGCELRPMASGGDVDSFESAELETDDGLIRWLTAIDARGVALVRGVPPTDEGLRTVAQRIGELRATNYGVTWSIDATVDPASAVDSQRPLAVHTDLPYREVAPGLQLLMPVTVEVAGGASTLVDGYAVAEALRSADPESWRLLTKVEFSYPFVRSDEEFDGRAPIIGLHASGRYHQIRRAPDLVGSPFVDAADTPALFAAVRSWTDIVDNPAHEFSIALQPGDLLAFDNHRMLHGRTGFELGAQGRRRLIGCDIDDLRSRLAVTRRRL